MSERLRNIFTIGVLAIAAVVVLTLVLTTPTEADRAATIGEQIKCPVCQGESIWNSPATMARDMMALVEERISEGATDEAIIDELLSSYSGALLLDPPAAGNTLALWIAPLIVLMLGAGVIVWWRRHPGEEQPAGEALPSGSGNRRALVGGLILIGSISGAVVVAGFFLQDRDGTSAGVANQEVENLDEVSNETMEAVIAANLDNPQVSGMRLALAERYYGVNDYSSAFPHYLAVAEAPNATSGEVVTALVRLGWMAWDGNAEVEAALGLFDQALAIDPSASTASYLKAQVLWCGNNDPEGAAALFATVLSDPDLGNDSRELVETDLAAVSAGEPCR
ncbi:MAG: cytochrome c-type biogenesis protein CcmH [Actinomycetota bacterium]|nr:cytochrome c-type biogenesis protein CcmH [Actinomycetota bacterium]